MIQPQNSQSLKEFYEPILKKSRGFGEGSKKLKRDMKEYQKLKSNHISANTSGGER